MTPTINVAALPATNSGNTVQGSSFPEDVQAGDGSMPGISFSALFKQLMEKSAPQDATTAQLIGIGVEEIESVESDGAESALNALLPFLDAIGLTQDINAEKLSLAEMATPGTHQQPDTLIPFAGPITPQVIVEANIADERPIVLPAVAGKDESPVSPTLIAASQIAASQIAVPQVAASQVAVPQVAVPQVAVPQVAVPQVAASQVAASQVAASQVAASQVAASQVAASQVAVPQVAASQVAASQVAVPQVAASQVAASQVAASQVAASQVAASQVAASQVAASQVAASQVAVPQVAASQVTASQVAVPQVAVPQIAVPQIAVPQIAVPQVAVPQVSVPQVAVPQVKAQSSSVEVEIDRIEKLPMQSDHLVSEGAVALPTDSFADQLDTAIGGQALPTKAETSADGNKHGNQSNPVSTSPLGFSPTGNQGTQAVEQSSKLMMNIAQPVGAAGWDHELGQRIVWMANRSEGRAELVLNPPQMGRVEVSLTVSGDQATASFASTNPVVREALESALPRLREVLAEAGIQLGQAQVGAENARQWAQHEKTPDNFGTHPETSAEKSSIMAASDHDSATSVLKVGRGLVDVFA